jgi:hypothetical protein
MNRTGRFCRYVSGRAGRFRANVVVRAVVVNARVRARPRLSARPMSPEGRVCYEAARHIRQTEPGATPRGGEPKAQTFGVLTRGVMRVSPSAESR